MCDAAVKVEYLQQVQLFHEALACDFHLLSDTHRIMKMS